MADLAAERAAHLERQRARHLEAKARRALERAGWSADGSALAEAVEALYPGAAFEVLEEAERLQAESWSQARHVEPAPAPVRAYLWPDVKRAECVRCGREKSTYDLNAYQECVRCAREVAA